MTRVSSFGSVGFVLVCLHLLPVTSHTMTPSPTHIGFSGSLPVQEIQGNPEHWYCLFFLDGVLHWACAVILRNRLRQLGTIKDQALEATGTYKFLSIDSVHGNPEHSVLFVHIDTVLHWACAVFLRTLLRQLGLIKDQALEATGTKTPSIDLRNVPKSSAYQTFKSCHQINLRPSNQTCITSAERVKDIPAKTSIAVHHVHPPLPRE